MATKPESTYKNSVHKYLPEKVHKESVGSGYSKGTPDCWYDGCSYDLWIEWKYASKIPKTLNLLNTTPPKLSVHQQEWLSRAHKNGRNIIVIVGFPTGSLILHDLEWMQPLSKQLIETRLISRKQTAAYITEFVTTP